MRLTRRSVASRVVSLSHVTPKKVAATLEAFHIHGPALDCVILDDLVGPFAKLHGAFVFYLETDGDNGLQIVMFDLRVKKTATPENDPRETGLSLLNGGGGGNRTPVRKRYARASTCLA